MNSVPTDIQHTIVDAVGDIILSTLTVVQTLYKDQQTKYSGTGMLLSYGKDSTYCLTANHVVNPSSRSHPNRTPVICHYYAESLQMDGDSQLFMLRRKYYKNDNLDLAMLESCLSGSKVAAPFRQEYFNYAYLMAAGGFDFYLDDIFVICGLPGKLLTEISVTKEFKHRVLLHFFAGAEGCHEQKSAHRYAVPYSSNISPHGLSGSPVWVIRERDHPKRALNIDYVRSHNSNELRLQASFAGIVVEHIETSRKLVIVKPRICALFAGEAEQRMPELRTPDEDTRIDDQLKSL